MDIAVVTGASSALGLAISRRLLSLGFRVYGLGGNYNDFPLQNVEFRPVPCDLADPGLVEHTAGEILGREDAVTLLVNNAKYYPADDFAAGAGGEFTRSLNINLLCPLILIRTFLPGLQRVGGKVVTINPAAPEMSRGGPVGAAAAGGLRWMQEVLLQAYRDYGISFSSVSPEPNRWRPADAPRPNPDRPQSAIDPQAIADAVESIVQQTRGNIVSEVVIRPARLVESTIPPMREVPYPKPQPIPYTVPRELIDAEEQLDREAEDRAQQNEDDAEEGGGDRKRRRRRRRRRGDRDEDRTPETEERREPRSERPKPKHEPGPEPEPRPEMEAPPAASGRTEAPEPSGAESPGETRSRRRRRGRKPRPAGREDKPPVSREPRPGPLEPLSTASPAEPARQPASSPLKATVEARRETRQSAAGPREEGSRDAGTPTGTAGSAADSETRAPAPPSSGEPPSEAAPEQKAPRKTARKASKKVASKTAKKATKKVARKAVKKSARKATKKAATKKVARKAVEEEPNSDAS